MIPCAECRACRDGHPNLCDEGIERGPGLGRPGAYAESVTVPSGLLRALPDAVSDVDSALVEPLGVAIRAIKMSQATPGEPVCVLGAGPIGMLAAVGPRARGSETVVVVEASAGRRAAAQRIGIPAVAPQEAGEGVPSLLGAAPVAVIDCTGHPSGAPLAIDLLAPAGRLAVVGMPDELVPIDLATLARYELTLQGSVVYSEQDFIGALDLMSRGRIPADRIITTIAPLDAGPAVVGDLASGSTEEVKVLLRPGQD